MTRRKQTKQRQSSRRGGIWWLFLLLAVALAAAWWVGESPREPRATVTAQDADYRAVTDHVQERIEQALTRMGHHVTRGHSTPKEAKREATGGTIHWTVCDMTVQADQPIRWPLLLQTATPTDGVLTVTAGEPDTWQGQSVMRYDIALNEDPDGVDWQMIMARLYVLNTGTKKAVADGDKAGTDSTGAAVVPVKPHRSAAGGHGKLAIVVDDCGYDLAAQAVYESLGRPFSLAVIPGLASSEAAARQGHAAGMEILLHLPMESMSGVGQEPSTILTSMSDSEIRRTAAAAMDAIPLAVGFNNHQGSKATSDARVMRAVLTEARARHFFYLDSRTAATSVGLATAREMGIPAGMNELFLDNSSDEAAICEQLREAIRIAARDGSAIVIGHARPSTAAAVRSMLAEIDAAGVELVFVSELVG